MTGAVLIVVISIVTAILAFIVAWRYRGKTAYIDWSAFLAMGLGSLSIGLFYLGIAEALWNGHDVLELAPYSRIIFAFILISTALMAWLVLRSNGEKDG